jgi:imidazole glycerol-phosphate synthase subunit HisH
MMTIVDYGMGNLYSVGNALAHLGQNWEVSPDPERIVQAERVILPGVGSFQEAAQRLQETGLADALRTYALKGRPLLGICLGMQLLAEWGEEGGLTPGLGLIPGTTARLQTGEKLPHVGWNHLAIRQSDPLLDDLPQNPYFYFVHSFVFTPQDPKHVVGDTAYGPEFCAMVRKDNLVGVQFHPEKSSAAGLRLLRNFAEGRGDR